MAVTFNANKKYYLVHVKGKKFTYSTNRWGPLAKLVADKSFKECKKLYNYIEYHDNYDIIKIYHVPTGEIHDIIIDKETTIRVEEYKWYINVPQNSKTLYAANDIVGKLHRYIMNVSDRTVLIDHINRNGLDNRLSNLRLTNNSENKKNMNATKSNKVGHNGICIEGNSYRVSWQENGRQRSKRFNMNKMDNALEEAIRFRKQKEIENNYL